MFIVATSHFGRYNYLLSNSIFSSVTLLVITLYRIVYLLDNDAKEVGSQKSLGNATSWHAIARDIIYMTQCILGDSVAVSMTFKLNSVSRQFIDLNSPDLPLLDSVGSRFSGGHTSVMPFERQHRWLISLSWAFKRSPWILVSGTIVCERLSTLTSYTGIFDPSVRDWIATFHAVALGQNTITTGLMAFRLWLVDRRSKAYNVGRSLFFATMLLLVESAALYFALQIVILVAFLSESNLQIIILGSIPPVVVRGLPLDNALQCQILKLHQGITFTLLTIRAAFLSKSRAEGSAESQTIGSIKMRDLGINIQISEEVVVKADSNDSPV
jgi:hypothetical protein